MKGFQSYNQCRNRKKKEDYNFRLLIAYKYIVRVVEHVTISMVYGLQRYSEGELSVQGLISYVEHDTLAREYFGAIHHFAPGIFSIDIDELMQTEVDLRYMHIICFS